MPRLTRSFFARGSVEVAPALIGTRLVRRFDDGTTLSGVIVEVEAYIGVKDRASHAFAGRRTARNEAMYSRPGTSYVYFTYGMHYCMNVVCASEGVPEAVLIRALEPEPESLAAIRRNRSVEAARLLCSGAGATLPGSGHRSQAERHRSVHQRRTLAGIGEIPGAPGCPFAPDRD